MRLDRLGGMDEKAFMVGEVVKRPDEGEVPLDPSIVERKERTTHIFDAASNANGETVIFWVQTKRLILADQAIDNCHGTPDVGDACRILVGDVRLDDNSGHIDRAKAVEHTSFGDRGCRVFAGRDCIARFIRISDL